MTPEEQEEAIRVADSVKSDSVPWIVGIKAIAVSSEAPMGAGALLVFVDEDGEPIGKMVANERKPLLGLMESLQKIMDVSFPTETN